MNLDSNKILQHFKNKKHKRYNEDYHCSMLLNVMLDKNRGTFSAFCVEAMITEKTFYSWKNTHELFDDIYSFCKLYAREIWEQEGREIRDLCLPIGTVNNAFEYWKLIGWSRFGVSKNSRIKLNLNADDTPDKHYSQLMKQACEGDFTAPEIKQLMEAINVGLNTYQVFELQKQIDSLKSDLVTMQTNSDGDNRSADQGTQKTDQSTLADNLRGQGNCT